MDDKLLPTLITTHFRSKTVYAKPLMMLTVMFETPVASHPEPHELTPDLCLIFQNVDVI